MKATHKGSCQVCGAMQKLPGGALAKHGYTVRWGFFSGVCSGAHHLPWEQSCDMAKQAIIDAGDQITDLQETMAALDGEATFLWFNGYISHRQARGSLRSGYHWFKVPAADVQMDKHGAVTAEAEGIRFDVSRGYEIRASLNDFTTEVTKDVAIATLNRRRIAHLGGVIREIESYIDWQRARVASWQPRDLAPV